MIAIALYIAGAPGDSVAMPTHRTTRCGAAGHREFTIQLTRQLPVPDLHRMLVDYFEGAVTRGTKFLPGQTVQVGWSTLRLCERSDGTLGVEERELAPEPAWIESVDRALMDAWLQKEVASSVELLDELRFPRQDEGVLVADCALEADAVLLTRIPDDDLPEGFSGWALACAEDHDHGERSVVPLLAVAANQPGLVQFLALPHGTSVFVVYREKPDAPAGTTRIEPHVFRDGDELVPRPGSYLAALRA
jgi:hypothetical protein